MTYATKSPALCFFAMAFAVALLTTAIPASAMDGDPSNQVPHWISESSFNSMNAYDLYQVDRAQRLGKRIVIEGYTASESRNLVDEALNTGTVATRSSFSE